MTNLSQKNSFGIFVLATLFASVGCGGNVVDTGDASGAQADHSTVTSFFYPSQSSAGPAGEVCPAHVGYDKVTGGFEGVMNPSPLSPAAGEALGVGSFALLEECSGLGGQHVVGRDFYNGKTYWFGGHGCHSPTSPAAPFAVFRFRQTAAMREAPQGWCIEFPDKSKISTDVTVLGVATFKTKELAESYATALGWKP